MLTKKPVAAPPITKSGRVNLESIVGNQEPWTVILWALRCMRRP